MSDNSTTINAPCGTAIPVEQSVSNGFKTLQACPAGHASQIDIPVLLRDLCPSCPKAAQPPIPVAASAGQEASPAPSTTVEDTPPESETELPKPGDIPAPPSVTPPAFAEVTPAPAGAITADVAPGNVAADALAAFKDLAAQIPEKAESAPPSVIEIPTMSTQQSQLEVEMRPVPVDPGYLGDAFAATDPPQSVKILQWQEGGGRWAWCEWNNGGTSWVDADALFIQTVHVPEPAMEPEPIPQPDVSPPVAVASEVPAPTLEVEPAPAPVPASTSAASASAPTKQELPSIHDIVLPGGSTLIPKEGEDGVDISAVLAAIPGFAGGSSTGGVSSHTLQDYQQCPRRVFYSGVLGLKPIGSARHLRLGELWHACWAMRYSAGADRTFDPCDAVAEAGAPKMAEEVRTLVSEQLKAYEKVEAATWLPRAVEQNMHWDMPAVKLGTKWVQFTISFRPDMLLGFRMPGENPAGFGPLLSGIWILDWKSSSWLNHTLMEGFAMDYQFKTYCAGYKGGGYEEVYGPLKGVMISIAEKGGRRKLGPDSFFRDKTALPAGIKEFIKDELEPLVANLYALLSNDESRKDITRWPRCTSSCIGRWGKCKYFRICDGGSINDRVNFFQSDERILQADVFGKVVKKPKNTAPAKPADTKKAAIKMEEQAAALSTVSKWLLNWFESDESYKETFDKSKFITPEAKGQDVIRLLAASLKEHHASMVKTVMEHEGKSYTFMKTGIKWKIQDGDNKGLSASLTWRMLATAICEQDWYSMEKVLPAGA